MRPPIPGRDKAVLGKVRSAAAIALSRLPQPLYDLHGPAAWCMWIVRIAAIALFLWPLAAFDLGEFIGLRQAAGFPSGRIGPDGETEPSGGLIVAGPYRLVRHPMYLAATASLFANPHMPLENLLFAAFALGYFLVGSVFEERRLLATFGPAYGDYQRFVPRLIPWQFARRASGDSTGG